MSPRLPLLSVGYAIRAAVADDVGGPIQNVNADQAATTDKLGG